MSRRRRDERGQTTLLIVGLAVVLMTAIAMVIDVTAAYAQRQALSTLADGAALAAADGGVAEEAIYAGRTGDGDLVIDPALAEQAAHAYLAGSAARFPGLRIGVHVAGDRRSVTVHVSAPVDLPLTFPGTPDAADIGASGAAAVSPETDEPQTD